MSPRRTWWHLEGLGCKPNDYDVATSRLLYHPSRGFEVEVPLAAWYERHQRGSPFACGDWEAFRDPRETTYAAYVDLQARREAYVDGLLAAMEAEAYEARWAPEWLATLERVLPPLRHPLHGLQMVAAYVGSMAPGGRIVIAAALQAADEMRRLQRVAYRTAALRRRRPGFGGGALAAWQDDAAWQPLREAVERALVAWDWGEAFVALDLVLKPALDRLFTVELARVATEAGDPLLAEVLRSLEEDCAWHRDWSASLVRTAVADRPANADVLRGWVRRWEPLARRAVEGCAGLLSSPARDAASGSEPRAVARRVREAAGTFRASIGLGADLDAGAEPPSGPSGSPGRRSCDSRRSRRWRRATDPTATA